MDSRRRRGGCAREAPKGPRHAGWARWVACALLLGGAGRLAHGEAEVAPGTPEIGLLELEGVINPLSARYLARELQRQAGAPLIVVRLDTPGGLESSMRQMCQAILGSTVPVVVYVSPAGARAASAGMFITLAAHVAAMAPGTNLGAAHPVGLGGDTDEVRNEKATSDAAALARAIAQSRGRNAAWAERAVRESVSITAEEALRAQVIDLVANDLATLLRQLDGRRVTTTAGEVTLRTAGARVRFSGMTLPERILHTLTDPNIAYLLFTLGLIGLGVELFNPGLLLPGITGVIALILAFVAFGSLPLNWAGLALVAVAVALFLAELHGQGMGALGAGGLVAFVVGSLMLYSPSVTMPRARVSGWLIGVMAALFAGFFLFLVRAVLRSRKAAVLTGVEGLVGLTAVAVSELAPEGTVLLNRETWRARAVGGPVRPGQTVRVTGVEGVTLLVTGTSVAGLSPPPSGE